MIKMIKTLHKNMTGVSNMADQGRIILQFYSVCNLSLATLLPKENAFKFENYGANFEQK